MLVYWAMLIIPGMLSLAGNKPGDMERSSLRIGFVLVLIAFSIIIGLRFETGGDWFNYQVMLDDIGAADFRSSFSMTDPGFGVITWISAQLGLGLNGPTTFCGAVLMYGVVRFSRDLPDPWVAIMAAVPYLLIVVGMGYIRQGAAIGFILLALRQFERGNIFSFLLRVGLALLFHVSALCILPIAGIALLKRRKALLVPLTLLGVVAYIFLLQDRFDGLYSGYVESNYDSSGTFIRLIMNALPSVLYLVYGGSFTISVVSRQLWYILSIVSIAMVPMLFILSSSTALDRIGLYFIPIQLYVFGHLAVAIGEDEKGERLIRFLIFLYYGAVLFTWLNYADNSYYWIPYKFLLLS